MFLNIFQIHSDTLKIFSGVARNPPNQKRAEVSMWKHISLALRCLQNRISQADSPGTRQNRKTESLIGLGIFRITKAAHDRNRVLLRTCESLGKHYDASW